MKLTKKQLRSLIESTLNEGRNSVAFRDANTGKAVDVEINSYPAIGNGELGPVVIRFGHSFTLTLEREDAMYLSDMLRETANG